MLYGITTFAVLKEKLMCYVRMKSKMKSAIPVKLEGQRETKAHLAPRRNIKNIKYAYFERQVFDDSRFTRKSLLQTLISIRIENCNSMTSYMTQIIETFNIIYVFMVTCARSHYPLYNESYRMVSSKIALLLLS